MYRPKTVVKKPSGAAFRKRKLEAESRTQTLPKIIKHFLSQSSNDESNLADTSGASANETFSEKGEIGQEFLENRLENDFENIVIEEPKPAEEDSNIELPIPKKEHLDISNSDIALFLDWKIDDILRDKILSLESSRPNGPFPKHPVTQRSFSTEYYLVKTPTLQKIPRQWLCYSELLNAVYCEVCWLFADRGNKHYHDTWTSGKLDDWQGLTKKIKKHETSDIHLQACIAHSTYKKNRNKIRDQFAKENEQWREVLVMILDTLLTMATCSIPLRGHRENISQIDVHAGNFLNIIELLSRYNPVMKNHIQNPAYKKKHLSPDIQNELLELAAKKVLEIITKDIRESNFFSLILDTTQDISKKDQLSLVIRYVRSNPEKGLIIKESFLGFTHIIDQGAGSITETVLKCLQDQDIDISKCRGQGYDGASVMSGEYSGIQARIKEFSPEADYMHCANHNLNLVLNDCVDGIVPIQSFYGIMERLYLFFSKSLPRWQQLMENKGKNSKGAIVHALKKLCPTRWSSRFESVFAIKDNFSSVLTALSSVCLLSKKKSEADDASALIKNISNFDFILMMVFQYKILEHVNHVSKILQYPEIKLNEACKWLGDVLEKMKKLRHDFKSVQDEAEVLTKSWGISGNMTVKRVRKVRRFHDELSLDEPIFQPLRKFQVEVFNAALDLIIQQLETRFQSMNQINSYFSFLTPESLLKSSNAQLTESAERLKEKYKNDLGEPLLLEIIGFRNLISLELEEKKISTLKHITDYLFIEHPILQSSFPNLCIAIILYLTLPVTSASAEKSFSKLKLIKTYLSNTMCQTRLSSIAVLSIENTEAKKINLNTVIDEFLNIKCRRGLH